MSLAAAARYARALVEIVQDSRSGLNAESAADQLAQFSEMLALSRDLRETLVSPAVMGGRKRAAVGRLCDAAGFHRLVKNFLFLLIDHRRTRMFDEIRDSFQAQMDEWQGVVRARVEAPEELGPEQRVALRAKLEAMVGKKVICAYQVEPALLGGLSVRIGSTRYDGSVRGHLEALRRSFGVH